MVKVDKILFHRKIVRRQGNVGDSARSSFDKMY